jgi:hypothetical protein
VSRFCACGCGCSLEGMRSNARYASRACRTRDWKRRRGITGIRYVKASQNGGRSGRQLTQRKAERAVETALLQQRLEARHGPLNGRAYVLNDYQLAGEVVREQLPARQRAILAAREQREETTT